MLNFLQLLALRIRTSAETDERGASLIEYALLIALIALVCIGAVTILGSSVSTQLSSISEPLN